MSGLEKNDESVIISLSKVEVMKLLEMCESVLDRGLYDESMKSAMFKIWSVSKDIKKSGFAIYNDLSEIDNYSLVEEDEPNYNMWGFPESSSPFKTGDMNASITELEIEPGVEYEMPELELFHSEKK